MLLALGFTFYRDPVAALSVISGLVIAFGSIVGALWLSTKSKSVAAFLRGDGKDDKPEGLVSMKYRALKSKICPVVQFEISNTKTSQSFSVLIALDKFCSL
jgi:hypothetical protein